jgi:hypothetical protein
MLTTNYGWIYFSLIIIIVKKESRRHGYMHIQVLPTEAHRAMGKPEEAGKEVGLLIEYG